MIEWSISLGNIIQIAAILGGGLFVLVAMRIEVRNLKDDVIDMKVELKKVAEILVNQAVTTHRVQMLEEWRRTVESRG